jgi:uncharacterized membrane protein YbhN (UPF0104 family)
MADTIDVLLHFIEENWTQARQHENQRATISNLIIIIAAALSGVVTQTGFKKNSLPLTILLIILGMYGVIATAKLYERGEYHMNRSRELSRRLNELCPDAQINQRLTDAGIEHQRNHKVLSKFKRIWLGLPILIVALGITFTLIILLT